MFSNRFICTIVLLIFSIHILSAGMLPAPSSQDETALLLHQAREMIQQKRFEDAVALLQRLLPASDSKGDRARIHLLLSWAHLRSGNIDACEESLRPIFENQLHHHVDPADIEADLRFHYSKVKVEYWYVLGTTESVDEKLTKRVISRPAVKPRKKPLWPKILAGVVVVGMAVALVLVLSGSDRDEGSGWEGETGLVFENTSYFPVTIDVSTYTGEVPSRATRFIALHPGDYRLEVTQYSNTYVYFVQIRDGERTYFAFILSPN